MTDHTARTVAEAVKLGYRLIDTSGDYGTQAGVGKGVRMSGIRRSDLYIVSKVEETEAAFEATIRNLNQLGMDYVDLMLIHRPPSAGVGEDLWRGLIRAQQVGFARDIGVSNYSISQIEELIDLTGVTPTVNQVEWTPFGHSEAMLDFARRREIILQAYSPLTHAERLFHPDLIKLARKYNRTPAQILIRWNQQLGVVPIPKARQRRHLKENIDVFDFALSDEDMATLKGENEHYSALGSLAYV